MGARSEKNISIMVIICFLGIFIGAFALALIASVMNGFEKATHEKLRGIHAQIIMRSFGSELDAPKIAKILEEEFPEVAAYSPTSYKQAMARKTGQEITNAVLIKAIDPALESKTSILEQKITLARGDSKKLSDLIYDNTIVIGNKLAAGLKLAIGDRIELLYIPEQEHRSSKVGIGKKEAVVSGIFSTGIDEFDSNLILASFDFVNTLFEQTGVTQMNIQLKPGAQEKTVITALKDRFNLDVFSWKDLYPALVAALKLEKFAMFFILALITLVASMNIISLIFMQIVQKRPDIAIYQSMGMANGQIVQLFMLMGVGIAIIATIAGLIAAYFAGIFLEKYPFITLPDTYYVTHLPVAMEWYIFALVFVLVVGMSIVATWIPTRNIRAIHAAQVLRFEG